MVLLNKLWISLLVLTLQILLLHSLMEETFLKAILKILLFIISLCCTPTSMSKKIPLVLRWLYIYIWLSYNYIIFLSPKFQHLTIWTLCRALLKWNHTHKWGKKTSNKNGTAIVMRETGYPELTSGQDHVQALHSAPRS